MKTLRDDTRGVSPNRALTLVVVISVAAIVGAFLLPVAVNELEGNTTSTVTLDVGNSTNPTTELNVTLDSVNGTPDPSEATYTLNDTRTGTSTQKTIAVGSEKDYDLNGGTVTVNLTEINTGSPGNATSDVIYPNEFSYSGSARSLWAVVPLALVLAFFMYLIYRGVNAAKMA